MKCWTTASVPNGSQKLKPGMKQIKCKFVMHCQHYAKKLTQKQREKSALARVKKAKAPLSLQLWNKKTDCPSNFTLAVQIPTKTQTRQLESKSYTSLPTVECSKCILLTTIQSMLPTPCLFVMCQNTQRRSFMACLRWATMLLQQGMHLSNN